MDAWMLRLDLYLVADSFPQTSPEYQTALLKFQNHLNDCQQCMNYLRYYAGYALPQPTGGE
jgi:hypothetical protein